MNSPQLQSSFPDTYRSFFERCSLVVSTPLMFDWMTANSFRFRGIVIKQKVPLRIYLGIEPSNDTHIEFCKLISFFSDQETFFEGNIQDEIRQLDTLKCFLETKYRDQLGQKRGCKIHCLTEVPFPHCMNQRGCFAACLSLICNLHFGQISPEETQNWKLYSPEILYQSRQSAFLETFKLSRQIDYIIKHGNSWGVVPFSAMVSSSYPIVTFCAESVESLEYKKSGTLNFSNIPAIDFWGFDLKDLFPNLPDKPTWPIEFGVLFSGKPVITEQELQKVHEYDGATEEIRTILRSKFGKRLKNVKRLPAFYTRFIDSKESMFERFMDTQNILSMQTMIQLYRIFLNNYDEKETQQFIELMKQRLLGTFLANPMTPYMMRMVEALKNSFGSICKYEDYAVFTLDDISLGGCMGFICKKEIAGNMLRKRLGNLQAEYSQSCVEYTSWKDGFESGGVTIDQDLKNKIISLYLKEKGTISSFYGPSGTIQTQALPDIILDFQQERIFIAGTAVTSKELHSQRFTMTLLMKLFEVPHLTVDNSTLPASSYTLNKNEMIGKVIIPFNRLVEKRVKKKWKLVCLGNNTQFTITLDPGDTTMLIKRNITAYI